MSLEIVCPACGTDDHVRGTPLGDGTIELTCSACDEHWTRDPRPRCPVCGGHDLYQRPKVILESSRGNQMSIQGIHVEYGCHECEPIEVKVRGGADTHLPDRLGGSQR